MLQKRKAAIQLFFRGIRSFAAAKKFKQDLFSTRPRLILFAFVREMFEVFQIDLSVRKCDEPFCRCGNKSVGRSTMTDGQGLNENSLKKQRATEAHGRHLQPRPWEKAGTKKGNPFSILYARRSFFLILA